MLEFDKQKTDNYISYLKNICLLSKLFTDKEEPYLYYRIAENIFCKVFNAKNLSRKDDSYDARIGSIGIGLKTFIVKGKAKTKREKIAEFDKESDKIKDFDKDEDKVKFIAKLRNERIADANKKYDISESYYHCVVRKENQITFFNTNYNGIDIDEIGNIKMEKKVYFLLVKMTNIHLIFQNQLCLNNFVFPPIIDGLKLRYYR